MAPVVEKILDGLLLGEGPHWDDKNQCLYFLDMTRSTIHKYVPSTKKHTQVTVGDQNLSIIIPVKGKKDEFVVTLDRSIALIHWDGESDKVTINKILYEVDHGTKHVFNDGKCDKTGRIWAGTMAAAASSLEALVDKQGTLYSFTNNAVKSHRTEIGIANGIAFDYKRNKMFYIDSYRKSLDQYDIDFETGTLSNLTSVFSNDKAGLQEGNLLDGMTIDTDGNLWVAVFGTSRVYQIDPKVPSKVLQYIEFPAKQITSVAFGGPNLDALYVTSANFATESPGISPGSVFRVTGLNAKGFPADEAIV